MRRRPRGNLEYRANLSQNINIKIRIDSVIRTVLSVSSKHRFVCSAAHSTAAFVSFPSTTAGENSSSRVRIEASTPGVGAVYEEVLMTSSLRCIKHSVEKVVTSFCIEGYYEIKGVS